jgi:type IV pilus assembly protein PilX
MRQSAPGNGGTQGGIALVVVLLLLLIVTLIGLAAMRGTLLQEQMAGNAAARGNAFQIAEAVLREGESIAAGAPPMPAAGEPCSNGLCPNPGLTSDGYAGVVSNFRNSSLASDDIEAGYLIEDMGTGSNVSASCTTAIDPSSSGCAESIRRYRVTARVHMSNGTEVVLQSRYQVE